MMEWVEQKTVDGFKQQGKEVPEHLRKFIASKGFCIWIPKQTIYHTIDRLVRPQVAKVYESRFESGDTSEIVSFTVGVRRADFRFDFRLQNYCVEYNSPENQFWIVILDEEVRGNMIFHVEKEARFFKMSFGDYHNKDYNIDFSLRIRKIIVKVTAFGCEAGHPEVVVEVSIENFDLERDLDYTVHNHDLLTKVVDIAKVIWMRILEKEIRDKLIRKINNELNNIVREEVQKKYKSFHNIEQGINLRVNLKYEQLKPEPNHVRLFINGHVENLHTRKHDKDWLLRLDHSCCGNLPYVEVSSDHDKLYFQVSNCAIYSAAKAYFLNDLSWYVPIEESMMIKGIKIEHFSHQHMDLKFHHPSDDGSPIRNLGIELSARLTFTVEQKYFPSVVVEANVKAFIWEIEFLGVRDDNKVHIKFAIRDVSVDELFNSKGEPLTSPGTKGIADLIKKKAKDFNTEKEISVDKIDIEGRLRIVPLDMLVFKQFVLLKVLLEF